MVSHRHRVRTASKARHSLLALDMDCRVKPITKAVLFALAAMKHGERAWSWGIYSDSLLNLTVRPIT